MLFSPSLSYPQLLCLMVSWCSSARSAAVDDTMIPALSLTLLSIQGISAAAAAAVQDGT